MASEGAAYNALNLHLKGDHSALSELRRRTGSWQEAFHSLNLRTDPARAEADLEAAGVRLILREEKDFPALLREIPLPPWGVYLKGNLPPADKPALAIVGTRRASPAGKNLAREFGRSLAGAGLAIVSGLAFGVDAAAHGGALEAEGTTLAVIAGGPDDITPRTNRELGERILRKGAIISEYPLGTDPLPHRFLARNRLIAGLARGTLIVEAPERSGALATARFAVESNREVFVIPGPAKDPNFAGSHRLIRSGAELVTSPEEVLESLGLMAAAPAEREAARTPAEALVLGALAEAGGPLYIDKIAELTNLNIQTASQVLTMLMLEGSVRETAAGYET